jgi:hypothetical protein
MNTDKLLDAWKRWIQRGTTLPVAMRDTEEDKAYPGVYIEGDSVSRFDSGGVMDSDAFTIQWDTKLVTTPGDTAQVATTKAEHDIIRNELALQVQSYYAETWMDSQLGIRVFQLLIDSPVTSEEGGYRVTTWRGFAVACEI